MRELSIIIIAIFLLVFSAFGQQEPGTWQTWFISSVKEYRLPSPPSSNQEISQVITAQKKLDAAGRQQIVYWNAGSPGYHWHEMINKLWMYDTSRNGALANLLLGTGIYDATVAAWNIKYAHKRKRPFETDRSIMLIGQPTQSPSYPCEHSVAAGVAVAILSHFYPRLADSVKRLADQLMQSRVAAGYAFPSDTKAGFELGKQIAEKEIDYTKDFISKTAWDGKIPDEKGKWNGKHPMYPMAGLNKTVVLSSPAELRPAPPPDFAGEMEELKRFKQNFRSQANAFYWASQDFWTEALNRKIFESNLHLDAPQAARIYAVSAVATYDCFMSCFDAKYAYWGIRPDQYDTTYHSLIPTPPFPGYPSGHAMMSGMYSELYAYFFPAEAAYFRKKAKEAAESRFQAGIHFRTDNEVGLDLGRKVAARIIGRIQKDGAGDPLAVTNQPVVTQKTKSFQP